MKSIFVKLRKAFVHRCFHKIIVCGWLMILFCGNSFSQTKFANPKDLTRILFLLDGSQSMSNGWDRSSRMDEAKRILSALADSLSRLQNVELGLRVYGHQSDQSLGNCHDTRLEVPFSKNSCRFIKKNWRVFIRKASRQLHCRCKNVRLIFQKMKAEMW